MIIQVLPVTDIEAARRAVRETGADDFCIDLMAPKGLGLCLKLAGVKMPAANILKQEMLSAGGDAAVHRGVIDGSAAASDVVLLGNAKQILKVAQKLKDQPFGLKKISAELRKLCQGTLEPGLRSWRCRRHSLNLSARPRIMGVLNVTPDSFSDGGSFMEPARAIEHGLRMAEDGADIIDVGGESTRPGSEGVTADEELRRVLPVIEALAKKLTIPISIDTSKAEVARATLKAGAAIVNDISGLGFDEKMAATVAGSGAGVVLMHIQGKPRDMQNGPHYDNVVAEVANALRESAERARAAGVEADRIAVDPGIGFGKTVAHNLAILNNLATLRQLGYPLVVGASRKSFIGKLDREAPADQRLAGSIAAAVAAVGKGADVVRVHDVAETRQALAVARAIKGAGW